MNAQPDLFDTGFTQLRARYDDGTYPAGFWDWLDDNWHIFEAFVRKARQAKNRGIEHWSARAIIHVLRWQTALRERGAPQWKINNNYTPGMARLAMAMDIGLVGFFSTRENW